MRLATSRHVSFSEPGRAQANLGLLKARLPEALFSALPTALAQVPDPDGALNRLERFTRELGRRVANALVSQPVLLHYLLALFAHSHFLSEMLIRQPDLILWLGRERNLERLKSKEELLEEYARFEATALDLEPALGLARFKRCQYLRITLRDILGLAGLVETTLELSTLADVLLEKAVSMAERELRQRYGTPQTHDARGRLVPARFAVLSLGKLGGNELNYSSDIDLLFLYHGEGETSSPPAGRHLSNSEFFLRLAQCLVQIITGVTREGTVFRVDLRATWSWVSLLPSTTTSGGRKSGSCRCC
jgi:glutamate-ammonia-ligase adenylyltransferase